MEYKNIANNFKLNILFLCVFFTSVTACRAVSPKVDDGRNSIIVDSMSHNDSKSVAKNQLSQAQSCPSKNFNEFLKIFSSTQNSHVRIRYTSDPLEYEVPSHTAKEGIVRDNSGMSVTKVAGADRIKYFSYRFVDRINDYRYVREDELFLEEEKAQIKSSYKEPVSIKLLAYKSYEVMFGMETEIDIFIFKYRNNCWYLSKAINTRD
jgi:hypothetical protein